jgi:hypothetical protein
MPVIRVSQQTWKRLKKHATPLDHTANDVVEMALDALEVYLLKGRHAMHVILLRWQRKRPAERRAAGGWRSSNFEAPYLRPCIGTGAKHTAAKFAPSSSE